MSNRPMWHGDDVDASVGSANQADNHREASPKGNGATRQNRSFSRSKPGARQQAVNDAHQSLHSLLNPQTPDGHPRVISSSGIAHRTHGRVVGPTSERPRLGAPVPESQRKALSGGFPGDSGSESVFKLPALPASSVKADGSGDKASSDTRITNYAARASAGLAEARKHAGMFLGEPGEVQPLAPTPPAPTASSWVKRHSTFIVVLVIVAVVATAGGIRAFGPQSIINHDLAAAQTDSGTDADEAGFNDTGQHSTSNDFQLALPRTQVSAPNSPAGQPDAASVVPPDVTRYTVAQGDTIESIADKFNVMPETVMGSNGIFDSQEELAPGRVLVVPPVDGMYYVAQKGDTTETVAQRFQVEPDAVTSYKRNVVNADGSIQEGQALVVPGGMMPARESVISYTVRRGDTLRAIAARFQVDVPTMINSNDIPDPDNLQPGSKLRVLPVPGVEYKVKKGDTIITIADRMGVSPQMILDYQPNHLTVDSMLKIDQVIMVPGGDPNTATASAQSEQPAVAAARIQPDSRSSVRPPDQPGTNKGDGGSVKPSSKPTATPVPVQKKPQPKQDTTTKKSTSNAPKVGTGSLIWPVGGARITQYFSAAHNGVDLAVAAGTPIHAADSGKVVWAGWRTDGLGYCVIIDHLDGITTVYGHQIRQPPVHVGQYVTRGQLIGWVGSTGHSTGPHVHFMVKAGSAASHAYRNPLAYLGR